MNVKSKVPPADPPPPDIPPPDIPPPLPGGLSTPLFQTPMSLVVVWAEGPLLVHRTEVPALIVREAGENVKSWMVTPTVSLGGGLGVCPPGLGICPPGGNIGPPGFGAVGEPLQATVAATAPIARTRERNMFPPEASRSDGEPPAAASLRTLESSP